jgi:hypothetical protein
MRRTTTKLMIAAAIIAAAAGSAFARTTTADYRTSPEFKKLATILSAATDERQSDEKARTSEKFAVPSRKPSDAPVLVAPCSICAPLGNLSPWQEIQLYISIFSLI